jgi:transcriptional regulator with PAS, ATPase and Fis domain
MNYEWFKSINASITVCDKNGIVVEMNDAAAKTFEKDGGYDLIGRNLFSCHSDNSNKMIRKLITDKKTNTYTIEKGGKKKLIFQTPWFDDEELAGLVEVSIELPADMPHHIRD